MTIYIDELCLAVRDLEATKRFFDKVIGLKLSDERIIVENSPGVARMATYIIPPVGELMLNIMTPVGPESVVLNRSLERRGEGLHHFMFKLDDPKGTFARCKAAGIRLVDPTGEIMKPDGVWDMGYTDPRVTFRTVIELH